MSAGEYPRVAIVAANPLRNDMANGIFMSSLFAGWPKDRLAQIYFPVAASYLPEFNVCSDFRMVRFSGAVRRIQQPVATTHSAAATGEAHGRRSGLVRQLCDYPGTRRWLKLVQEMWYGSRWIGKQLESQLRELKPDIVFAVLGNYCLTKIICQACETLDIPIYSHTSDDFVTTLYQNAPFASRLKSASDRWYRRIINRSEHCMAISPTMADAFRQRYGRDWSWFTTLVDSEDYDPQPRQPDGIVRLVYAGNLGLNRWSSLRQLGLMLQSLQATSGMQCQLMIYSSPDQIEAHRDELEVGSTVELKGWAAPKQLPGIFHDADILVHAESFDPIVADYTKLSFSTKLSQYMMAGRCVLAVGPRDLGSMRTLRESGAGLTIDNFEDSGQRSACEQLLLNAELRLAHAVKGREWALKWAESRSGRERFRTEIVDAVHRAHQHRKDPAICDLSASPG